MELIDKITPIIVAIIAAVFGQPVVQLINSLSRRKLKKITTAFEANALFEKFETDFKDGFILCDLKETYFYIQTGIKTNEKSIDKYIDLKNRLGGNYTWNHIKTAKPHLEINEKEIEIRLKKVDRVAGNVFLIFALILFIIGFIGFLYLSQLEVQDLKVILLSYFVLLAPMLFGYLFVNAINSIIVAKDMEKQLARKENNCA